MVTLIKIRLPFTSWTSKMCHAVPLSTPRDKLSGAKLTAKYFPWRRNTATWRYIPGRNNYIWNKITVKKNTTSSVLLGIIGVKALERPKAAAVSATQPSTPNHRPSEESNPGGYKINWKQYSTTQPKTRLSGTKGSKTLKATGKQTHYRGKI